MSRLNLWLSSSLLFIASWSQIQAQCVKLANPGAPFPVQMGTLLNPAAEPDAAVTSQIVGWKKAKVVYPFELEVADQSGLAVDEVLGLTRNFVDDPGKRWVTDGSIGIFQRTNGDLYVDGTRNVFKAYQKAMDDLQPGEITVDQILEIRKLAIEFKTPKKGSVQETPELEFRDTNDSADIFATFSDEVEEKHVKYGYVIEKYMDEDKGAERARITQTGTPDLGSPEKNEAFQTELARLRSEGASDQEIAEFVGRTRLQMYVDELNRMVNDGEPPNRIVAFAAQELGLIHPFRDGNGRMARLMGQVLYRKFQSKTLIMGKHFHYELNYSLSQLESAIDNLF